jgi:hypothetical protein
MLRTAAIPAIRRWLMSWMAGKLILKVNCSPAVNRESTYTLMRTAKTRGRSNDSDQESG